MSFRVIEKHVDLGDMQPWSTKELGRFYTEKEAVAAAIHFRQRNNAFDFWEDGMKHTKPAALKKPPFCSWSDCRNLDDDDGYLIFVVDEAIENNKNRAQIEKLLAKEAGSRSVRTGKLIGMCSAEKDKADPNLFIRNPSRLSAAVQRAPSSFPGTFVDQIRRASNSAYGCKSVACGEGDVQLSLKRPPRCIVASLVWIPETNLNDQCPGDATIVDTIHTDLCDNVTGIPRLAVAGFAELCLPTTKHLMLNKFGEKGNLKQDYVIVAEAITKCSALETFSALEWVQVPACIFEALENLVQL